VPLVVGPPATNGCADSRARKRPFDDNGAVLLTTGATGYLGCVLVDLLARRGYEVRAVVRDRARAAALLPRDVELAVADLGDADGLRRAAEGCRAVVHLAGTVGGTPEDIHRVNVDGTRAVLAAATAAGVPTFVHTGTGAALMDATGLMAEEPVAPRALTDPYSTAKAEADALVLASGLDVRIVSPACVYGPSPLGPRAYTRLLLDAANGTVREVVDATVNWVLAQDVAAGTVLALERGEPGHRYLLGGETASYRRVLHAFAALTGGTRVTTLPPGSVLGPDAGPFARRSEVYGHFPPVRFADAGARALGYTPTGVDEGLARTVQWLRAG
jgi:dihydroflavonol-4-reductase